MYTQVASGLEVNFTSYLYQTKNNTRCANVVFLLVPVSHMYVCGPKGMSLLTTRGGSRAGNIHVGLSSSSMGLEWTGFLIQVAKATISSKD